VARGESGAERHRRSGAARRRCWSGRPRAVAKGEERKAAPGPGEPMAPARPSLAVAAMPVRSKSGDSVRARVELWRRRASRCGRAGLGESASGAARPGRARVRQQKEEE
jgi:hypothetical protein